MTLLAADAAMAGAVPWIVERCISWQLVQRIAAARSRNIDLLPGTSSTSCHSHAARNQKRRFTNAPCVPSSRAAGIRSAIGVRQDSQRRIEAAIGDVHAGVDHINIVDIMKLAVAVHHRSLRIVAHAAGPRLVLSAAQRIAGNAVSRSVTAPASFNHASALPAMKRAISRVCGWRVAGEPRDRDSPVVLHFRVHLYARIEDRHLLHRALDRR